MISWVRDRWIQTRKRGDESGAATGRPQTDEEEDEDEEEEEDDDTRTNSTNNEHFYLNNDDNEEEEGREDFIENDADDSRSNRHRVVSDDDSRLAKSHRINNTHNHHHHNNNNNTCPLRQERPSNSSSSPGGGREHSNRSKTSANNSSNRSIHSEKHNSKLEIRKKSSVAPSTVVTGAGPSSNHSALSSPQAVAASVVPDANSSPTYAAAANSQRPSFGFLSRRFFLGSRSSSRTHTTAPLSPSSVADNNHPNRPVVGLSSPIPSRGRTDSYMSIVPFSSPPGLLLSQPGIVPSSQQLPTGVCTAQTQINTGTISKYSTASANCTRGFKSSITIRVISIKGGFIDVTFPIAKTAKELKLEAIGRFAVDSHSPQLLRSSLAKYKLVSMNPRNVIDEELTLERLGLKDKDQLLLVVKRTAAEEAAAADAEGAVYRRKAALEEEMLLKGPSAKEIQRATEHLPASEQPPPKVNIDDMVLQTDLQYDIRKILISLAQSSAYVIGAGPYADRLILMLKQRLINKRRGDTDSLNCLLDMGFAKARAIYALQVKNFVYADALRWLIENPRQAVPTVEEMERRELFEEIRPLEGRETMISEGVKGDGGEDTETDDEEEDEEGQAAAKKGVANVLRVLDAGLNSFNSRREYIDTLLEIIRIHSQQDLPVADEMVAKLMEMGFAEGEVREALKITQNNQAAACEWLIGSRSKSLTELRDGLPADSPILRALLASPQVQISLGNPKMLLAYLSMLENYSSMNMWLNDTDTSGVLGQILRTYHEEKHIVAINQFSMVL